MHFGGTWERGSEISDEARRRAREALEAALEIGIDFFDHANVYCWGRSERLFGELAQEMGLKREDYVLQSKVGIRYKGDPTPTAPKRYEFSYAHIMEQVEGSLERLQTDYLDCLLLHRPDILMEVEEIAQAFNELQAAGKVRHFGVSNHTPWQLMRLEAGLEQPLEANQVELNLLKSSLFDASIVAGEDREPMPATVASGTLDYHQLKGIRTQAWAPLAYGYLSGRPIGQEFKFEDTAAAKQRIADTSVLVSELAEKYGVSREGIVIGWVLRHPAKILPIIGTRDPGRLKACAEATQVTLEREDWYRLYNAGRGQELP